VTASFAPFEAKMREAGLPDVAVRSFGAAFEALVSGASGLLSEREIEPVHEVPDAAELADLRGRGVEALPRTVVIKLNGGLGTSMGMTRAKSLLPVKDGLSFLDVIARQIVRLRERHGVAVPLVLMDSFRTQADSLAVLARYGKLSGPLAPDFLQHKVPRIAAADLTPVRWPAAPEHEWCPPGHGDIYPALLSSGELDGMLAAGYRTAFVSNSDNLGAVLDLGLLGWFVETRAPFAMEVSSARTPTARAATSPAAAAAGSRCARWRSARRPSWRASRTSRAGASSTRTTCGSTSRRCTKRSRRAAACCRCR
jgi:UTP--glucose-1-phosphate uridylyltransferase